MLRCRVGLPLFHAASHRAGDRPSGSSFAGIACKVRKTNAKIIFKCFIVFLSSHCLLFFNLLSVTNSLPIYRFELSMTLESRLLGRADVGQAQDQVVS